MAMETVKEEWNRLLWVEINHQIDVGLQMKKWPYTCEVLESFMIILIFIL